MVSSRLRALVACLSGQRRPLSGQGCEKCEKAAGFHERQVLCNVDITALAKYRTLTNSVFFLLFTGAPTFWLVPLSTSDCSNRLSSNIDTNRPIAVHILNGDFFLLPPFTVFLCPFDLVAASTRKETDNRPAVLFWLERWLTEWANCQKKNILFKTRKRQKRLFPLIAKTTCQTLPPQSC